MHPQAVYTVLREAEYRSTYPLPYWNVAALRAVVPRQRRCQAALRLINATLDSLIVQSKRLVSCPRYQHFQACGGRFVILLTNRPRWPCPCLCLQFDEEAEEFGDDFLSDKDPSILHFLLASGDEVRTLP